MTIYFRVDGNNVIGYGHIFRCIALGLKLKMVNCKVIFLIRKDQGTETIMLKYRFPFIRLKSPTIFHEPEEINGILFKENIKNLIIDHYQIDSEYIQKIRADYLIILDDFRIENYENISMIINQGFLSDLVEYPSGNVEILKGIKYCLLREEFEQSREYVVGKVNKILLTMGGSDVLEQTPIILDILNDLQETYLIDVVVGPGFSSENIKKIYKQKAISKHQITIYRNVTDIKKLMEDKDIAISAAGMTIYELLSQAVFTAAIIHADNQREALLKLDREEIIYLLADGRDLDRQELLKKINLIIKDANLRHQYITNGRKVVDGKGAERCAREILKLITKNVSQNM